MKPAHYRICLSRSIIVGELVKRFPCAGVLLESWGMTKQENFRRTIEDVLHLINPPVAKEIETDPTSRLPEPVDNAVVSVNLPKGKLSAKTWVLTAESWRMGEAPKTQAVPLEGKVLDGVVMVTVPQVIYWKTLVFRFE